MPVNLCSASSLLWLDLLSHPVYARWLFFVEFSLAKISNSSGMADCHPILWMLLKNKEPPLTMYHDEREITADKLIEIFDARIKEVADISRDDRLMLMLVVIISLEKRSITLSDLSIKLTKALKINQISLRSFSNLLQEAKNLIEVGEGSSYLISHLTAKIISLKLSIDYRHPKLIAAIVGTIQSTLSTPLLEALPNTSELSLGLQNLGPKDSFPMLDGMFEQHNDLIAIRLAANDITANFVTLDSCYHVSRSTTLLDSIHVDTLTMLETLNSILKQKPKGPIIIIQNWTNIEASYAWNQISKSIEGHGEIEAIINFSSLPNISEHCTALIINANPIHTEILYIDVSMSNKSLPPLDGIERMLLAGCIYNLWQGRTAHRNTDYLSRDVARFVNSYFREGFRPISGLCNIANIKPKSISKTRLASKPFLKLTTSENTQPTLTDNSKLITSTLEQNRGHCCIYIIGNNGEGKSFLLRDIVYQLSHIQRRTIGLPISHADRFPQYDKSIKNVFEYKGARTTKILKEIGVISSQPRKIKLLINCLRLIGFGLQIYLTLKSELSHDRSGNPRRDNLDLINKDDMQYLNAERDSINEYRVNFIREGTRTILFENLSSGEQSILSLLIKIIASDANGATFLIDEPEISLHVSWQQKLPQIINLLSIHLSTSFVIATHSPVLIANAAHDDICYVSKVGDLKQIPVDERHSVETILMDGFETYTPHNREVHERCAKLVASLISTMNTSLRPGHTEDAVKKLKEFRATVRKNLPTQNNERQSSDLDLIEKTLAAISILNEEVEKQHG
ncbi:AAA family ATPase [Pseudomonas viridiflava]|uniref:AAA family ATPase n=1 Tax=Pseudomonas viridiflava TaxID=33069 RepID=UPI0020160DE6|nr:AAA family ATPase [Pseudomonas viridiflava]